MMNTNAVICDNVQCPLMKRCSVCSGKRTILQQNCRLGNLKFGKKHGWWSIRAPSKFQVKSIITS